MNVGSTAVLSVVAAGTGPQQYQWLYNGARIAGQIAADLDLLNLRLQIEVSEDLQAWTLFKGPYNSGTLAIDDPEFLLLDSKFYRIVTAP